MFSSLTNRVTCGGKRRNSLWSVLAADLILEAFES